jgi:eukaryotic-like serine/threonine-protein kinase
VPERYLGQTLGKYRVEELIGSGGFAWVYRGYDPELEIPVALKVLKPQFGGDKAFEERFRREASTAAKLRHPNIIKIYAVGRHVEAVYFAMDYLPTNLADKLEATPSLPEEFVVRVGMDVSRALGFAHREGVIHRDIKVDNILFDVHGNAVVADFGIARAVSGYTQQTGTNMVVGTPQYFAPEQARAKPLDGRADIYSLGVTLYRAATGRLPFEGDDWYEIARQHVEDAPPPPRAINPAISETFERILLRCLAKHADDRPPTGEELCDELSMLLGRPRTATEERTMMVPAQDAPTVMAPVGVTPSGATPRPGWTSPQGRRKYTRVALPALFILVALGGAAAQLLARRFDRDPGPPGGTSPESLYVMRGGRVNAPPIDSVGGIPKIDSGTKALPPAKDTSTRPRPTTGIRLVVQAPEQARITINDVPVSEGRFLTDTLKAGDYRISAAIEAMAGCETARVDSAVRLRPGRPLEVTLTPVGCGVVQVRTPETGARWTLFRKPGGGFRRSGDLPVTDDLVVPAGEYSFTAGKPRCTSYTDTSVVVTPGRTTPVTFTRLLCNPPPSR